MTAQAHRWRFVRFRSPVDDRWMADPTLRARLIEDSLAEGSSMTAVSLRILCDHYGVEYTPTGRAGKPAGDGHVMNLRVPEKLDRKIALAAASKRRSVQAEILAVLSAHYTLPIPQYPPRTRNRAARVAA